MSRMTDLARVRVVTAHATGDLDALRDYALTALDDLDTVISAYDGLSRDVVFVTTRGTAS